MTRQAKLQTIDTVYSIPNRKSLSQILWIGGFSILTAIGAQVAIPTYPVPVTLQTFFVILSGAFLGAKKGFSSQIAYLVAGSVGLPVFANGSGSILHLFGPTGGYLIGFPIAAYIIGYIVHDLTVLQKAPRFLLTLSAMVSGVAIIFLLGVTQLYLTVFHNWQASFDTGFLSLQWWDGLKILAAASIYNEVSRRYSKINA